ncbi:MAG: hypothetical protein JRI25_14290 [Deltaproteobacteria bacterium]|nr:hypothetical protein [Deltaproteobacteria bacterium]MBW2255753.1 hypothetical protein [Deltaproteobacteria bacterium]
MRRLASVVALAAFACGGSTVGHWSRVAQLPTDFTVTRIVTAPDAVLVGYRVSGPTPRLPDRTATVFTVHDGSAQSPWSAPGWFVDADAVGDEVWALHATLRPEGEGSDYALVTSADGGRSWQTRGPIPATSLTRVRVEGDGCGWAHGVQFLLRSCDHGNTWSAVEAPGFRKAIGEPLAVAPGGTAVLGGRMLQRTTDGGSSWTPVSHDEVVATDGTFVVARNPLRVGRIAGDVVAWAGQVPGDYEPDGVTHVGEEVWVRAAPLGRGAGSHIALFYSPDGGNTFQTIKARGGSDTNRVGFGPDGTVYHLDQGRQLKVWKR